MLRDLAELGTPEDPDIAPVDVVRANSSSWPGPVDRAVPGRPARVISAIRGVRAPRYDPSLTAEDCALYTNLLVLCLPYHGEVDDRKTGEKNYPVPLLMQWKADHEGSDAQALAALGAVDEERLTSLLLEVFSPPVKRLQKIADQLEETGVLTSRTVAELRQIVRVMADGPTRNDMLAAELLAEATGVLGSRRFTDMAEGLAVAASILGTKAMDTRISNLHGRSRAARLCLAPHRADQRGMVSLPAEPFRRSC